MSKIDELKIENEKLKAEKEADDDAAQNSSILKKLFTENEIIKLSGMKKRVKWTSSEIAKAFTLRYLSKRAYVYFHNKLGYPLPGWYY